MMRDDWYLYDPNNIVYLITDSKIKLIEDLPATASLYLMMELHMFFISINRHFFPFFVSLGLLDGKIMYTSGCIFMHLSNVDILINYDTTQ